MASTVNDNQGSHKGSTRRGLFGRRSMQAASPGGRVNGDAQSAWIVDQVRALIECDPHRARPVAANGSHPSDLLHELGHLAWDLRAQPSLDCRQVVERLRPTMQRLSDRAVAEQEAEDTFRRRAAIGRGTAQATGRQFEAAVGAAVTIEQITGQSVELDLDPEKIGRGLGQMAANARDPLGETMHGLPVITKDTPDPRLAAAAPVEVTQVLVNGTQFPPFGQDDSHLPHPGVVEPVSVVRTDGSTPPVPDEGLPAPDPLPRRDGRHPQSLVSFPAVMVGHGEDAEPRDGGMVPAVDLVEGFEGVWLLDEHDVWSLIADVIANDAQDTVTIKMATGMSLSPRYDRGVWVLSASAAQGLLAEYLVASGGAA